MNCGIDGLESHCEQSLSLRASLCVWVALGKASSSAASIPTNVEAEEGNFVIVAGVFSFFFGQGKKQLRRQTYVGFSWKA